MANFSYEGVATFIKPDNFKVFAKFPVRCFAVAGGATRVITLISTNEISITSELEQARMYENIRLFKPPSKDFTDATIVDVFHDKREFNFVFDVSVYSGGKFITGLSLQGSKGKITNHPNIVGKQSLLSLDVSFKKYRLGHIVQYKGGHIEWDL